MALQIQQAFARVQQCLEDPLISAPFPEEICAAITTCVEREQAFNHFCMTVSTCPTNCIIVVC